MTIALLAALFFVLGLYLTMKGGDAFVESAAFIAAVTGVPQMIVGATIVSLATTAPELFVSVLATLRGANDMAAGNAIGSVCCNTGLILGLALLFLPGRFDTRELRVKGGLLFGAAMLFGPFCIDGALGPLEALALVGVLAAFLWCNVRGAQRSSRLESVRVDASDTEKLANGCKFALGAGAVLLGAHLMVENGTLLARLLGVPEGVIGLTLVAVGTSLPELMTALAAIRHHQAAMSVGNILGANIIDLTMVPAACALAAHGTLTVGTQTALRDTPFALLLAGVALLPAMRTGRMHRWQGIALTALYMVYVGRLLVFM